MIVHLLNRRSTMRITIAVVLVFQLIFIGKTFLIHKINYFIFNSTNVIFPTKFIPVSSSLPCNKKTYKTGIVCVCNSTYCDNLEFSYPENEGDIRIFSSSYKGLRFEQTNAQFKESSYVSRNVMIINRAKKFQQIVGFGNAFTGAVAHNLDLLPSELQHSIYESYFSMKTGIAMNMLRMPIGGCDFDLEPWAYNELPIDDKMLTNFTKLDKRDLDKVQKIKELKNVTGNHDIKLVGAAWSPPRWMKTNNAWTGYSSLKDEYYQTWADYHANYLRLMQQEGLDYWAISTGNEPLNGVLAFPFIKFMSLGWLPSSQAKWVAENLGPLLRKQFPSVKLLAGDDQRYVFPTWFRNMYSSYPASEKFVDGHAVHWYWDKLVSASGLKQTHELYPNKLIVSTEACSGDKPWEEHFPIMGSWKRAEDYAMDILDNLNNFANAWIDWNMLLDERGGPNYVNNTVDAAIVINSKSEFDFVNMRRE